ncbi:MAG: T9SS type A sorting domain-containing protein [Bacteroidales bacterium]|nr:T9SS type A sorting domain-containing protein [Bacteroidales bacterium]
MKKLFTIILFSSFICVSAQQEVTINIDINQQARPISPYIFGKNNCLSDRPGSPLTSAQWQKLRDLGIQMFRENGGNNATKYNWRRKLSSHPNWYNNVYAHDWDYAAQSLQSNIPHAQGMWAFQLAGKAAKTMAYNFNDYSYNGSQWWEGVEQNVAGGGQVNTAGGTEALVEGNPSLYLESWDADSTTGILDRWFGTGGIGLDTSRIMYWSMDNEPEIWSGTHDDIWPVQPDAESFMQMYFATAKKARAKFPGIKLVGPVPANEWQWYNWNGNKVSYNGKQYVWLEYFILRIAEEQQATGTRLLDVLDIHFYPGEKNPADIVQLHRVFFDETYAYPGANGVRRSGTGSWDVTLNKEYIFKRCNNWLEQYIGPGHGVTLSVSETGIEDTQTDVTASWYASNIGEFMKQGVEIFTPWTWKTGMNEVLHLFSRYSNKYFIDAISSNELYVSAYTTVNSTKDSMTVFLVNRHLTESRNIDLNITGFPVKNGLYNTFQIYDLPASETFVSHTSNALKKNKLLIENNKPQIQLPPLSVTALVLKRADNIKTQFGYQITEAEAENGVFSGVTVSNAVAGYSGTGYVTGFDNSSDKVTVEVYIPEKNLFKLMIRYRSADGQKYQNLLINNQPVASIRFLESETFTYTDAGSYILEKGINNISILSKWGYTDIDKFEIYPAAQNIFDLSPGLVDTAASETANDVYSFLLNQFGERIISGQTHDYYSEVTIIAGKSPMIRVADFQHFTEGYPYLWYNGGHTFGKDDDGSVNELINWYNSTGKKGIISYQWHWHSPFGGSAGTNTFYTSLTTFDVSKAVIPGTPEYDSIIRDIDDIAAELKKFQDAGIPVLWRPLHEAGGGWFWWGAKGPEPCKELYNILFERLKNHHHLHNLIWVWSTPEEEWYPGNDKVDIIGYDSYPGEYNYSNQKYAFDELFRITQGKKLIAMTENGPIPDPTACLTEGAPWLYFMSWSDLVTQQNSTAHIQEVFNHPDVISLESDNVKTSRQWRSSLYPEDWKPGFKDSDGRFLHDFSYAGYHSGEKNLPDIQENILNVTLPPYNADNTGVEDVTSVIQKAIEDAGASGGGVVYLPEGTYRIVVPDTSDAALLITGDSIILRGDGPEKTFIFHDQDSMRFKSIIKFGSEDANWFEPKGFSAALTTDLLEPSRIIPVDSVSGFKTGDMVVIASQPTDGFIEDHLMTGYWTAGAIKGVAFLRRIDSVDTENNLLFIDAPTRYFLKTRDHSAVYHAGNHISECAVENLSVGNRQNSKSGWEEESYSIDSTGAYDAHFSQVITFRNAVNCWLKNVSTYKPATNTEDFHVLSNCLLLDQSRFITVDSCNFQKPQYEGGGGNGYMYTLQSNDCLIKNSIANHARHNYDFKYPYSNGNVIHNCRAENSKYASDFHMYLSMANLFDACTVSGDYLESAFRPWGSSAIHGYSSTQSVFYNIKGEAYHPARDYIVESRQFGNGYIIGTSGEANKIVLDPAEGIINGYYYNTMPRDFAEGVGNGDFIEPISLYLDQLERRMKDTVAGRTFEVNIVIKDKSSDDVIPGCEVKIYNETIISNESGIAGFSNVLEVFVAEANHTLYIPMEKKQVVIISDTTLTFYLEKKTFSVDVKLYNENTNMILASCNFTLNDITKTTNSEGLVSFTVTAGISDYSVQKNYFQSSVGTFEIISDTTVNFYLRQILADVKFRLYEDGVPLNNALVKAKADSIITNSLGLALFRMVTVPSWFEYSITKEGYIAIEDNFYLVTDTTIELNIQKVNLTNRNLENPEAIQIWPNPAERQLYCHFPKEFTGRFLNIVNLLGNVIGEYKIDTEEMVINVENLESGLYFINTGANEEKYNMYFIKK